MLQMQKILQGNSLQVLKQHIQDKSIDIVITSPPYNVAHEYDVCDDNLDFQSYLDLMRGVFSECYRVLKTGGRICINVPFAVKNRKTKEVKFLSIYITQILNEIGFKEFELITWHKGKDINHFQGNNTAWGSWKSPSCPSFRPLGESVLVFYKERRVCKGDSKNIDISGEEFKSWTKNIWYFDSDKEQIYDHVLCVSNNAKKNLHPAPYPEELVERLLKIYSYQDDVVLDPFLGTGTTAVVAHKMQRQYIGIELSSQYCTIAQDRIDALQCNMKQTEKEISKNIVLTFQKEMSGLVNNNSSKGTFNEFFPYKEGFGSQLLEYLKKKFAIKTIKSLLDPFCGSGSSFLNSNIESCYGFDTSPLACKITEVKLKKLNPSEVMMAKKHAMSFRQQDVKKFEFPAWKSYARYVKQDTFNLAMSYINFFDRFSEDVRDFIKFLVISNLDSIFDYKKDGNGIKYRISKITNVVQYLQDLTIRALDFKLNFDAHNKKKFEIKNVSSVEHFLKSDVFVDCILTSPPYANMFDYFEIYKMELWTSGMIKSYDDWKRLKKSALRNNKNANLTKEDQINNEKLQDIIERLKEKNVEGSTITMLSNYFYDMQRVLKHSFESLKKNSFCFIVVGNSCYRGIPIVTDEILAQEAEKIGFECQEILVARQIKTSSQQMRIIGKKEQNLLRESIIVLFKE